MTLSRLDDLGATNVLEGSMTNWELEAQEVNGILEPKDLVVENVRNDLPSQGNLQKSMNVDFGEGRFVASSLGFCLTSASWRMLFVTNVIIHAWQLCLESFWAKGPLQFIPTNNYQPTHFVASKD